MNNLKFLFRQLLKNFTAVTVLSITLLFVGRAFADLAIHQVEIAPSALKSRVPEVTAQGRFLASQAISAVDVSADGKFITIRFREFRGDQKWAEEIPSASKYLADRCS